MTTGNVLDGFRVARSVLTDAGLLHGDYLIFARKPDPGTGYYHSLTERAFLLVNVKNFLFSHPDISVEDVEVYELKSILGKVNNER